MEKMSIIKNLLAKAGKPQDQTCALNQPQTTDPTLVNPITLLSSDGTGATLTQGLHGTYHFASSTTGKTITIGPHTTNSLKGYPRQVNLKSTDLGKHPAFELTVEQLRAAWMLSYGTRWISMETPLEDDYLNVVAQRLVALGEVETHNVVDQYAPMARIKV